MIPHSNISLIDECFRKYSLLPTSLPLISLILHFPPDPKPGSKNPWNNVLSRKQPAWLVEYEKTGRITEEQTTGSDIERLSGLGAVVGYPFGDSLGLLQTLFLLKRSRDFRLDPFPCGSLSGGGSSHTCPQGR